MTSTPDSGRSITDVQFNNTSELDLRRVIVDPPNVADQLRQYVAGFEVLTGKQRSD